MICCCWVPHKRIFYGRQVGNAAPGVIDLNVTDLSNLTTPPQTPGCLRGCGGCKLKQAGHTEGKKRSGHQFHVGTVTGIISSTSCETLRPAVPVWKLFLKLLLLRLQQGCAYLRRHTQTYTGSQQSGSIFSLKLCINTHILYFRGVIILWFSIYLKKKILDFFMLELYDN